VLTNRLMADPIIEIPPLRLLESAGRKGNAVGESFSDTTRGSIDSETSSNNAETALKSPVSADDTQKSFTSASSEKDITDFDPSDKQNDPPILEHEGLPPKFYGPVGLNSVLEEVKKYLGMLFLFTIGPIVAFHIAVIQLWEFLDQKIFKGCYLLGKLSEKLSPITSSFVRYPETDGFLVHFLIWLGLIMPAYFFYELYLVHTHGIGWDGVAGFSWKRIALYNMFRIGPMYRNFMHCYTWCHKEAHTNGNLWNLKWNQFLSNVPVVGDLLTSKLSILKYPFNSWCALFQGVVPGTFTYSHLYNHHRYDNDDRDIYCTAFRPRDSFDNLLKYIPEFFGYATNITTLAAFYFGVGKTQKEKAATRNYKHFQATLLSTLYYVSFVAMCWKIHALFTFCTLVYALLEGNILLAIVNMVWHAFIDDRDPSSDFINSTNVIEGLNFTANEEYHTMHHQYAGAHWTSNRSLFDKHDKTEGSDVSEETHGDNIEAKQGKVAGSETAVSETVNGSMKSPGSHKTTASTEECNSYQDFNNGIGLAPTVFYRVNVFDVFAKIIAKDYYGLADDYCKEYMKGASRREIALLMKRRLRTHGKDLAEHCGKRGSDAKKQL